MNKLQVLKDTLLTYRRAKDALGTRAVSTLIGEVDRLNHSKEFAKLTEDDKVVMVLTKTFNGLVERRDALPAPTQELAHAFAQLDEILQEMRIVEALMDKLVPKQLADDDLEFIIIAAVRDAKAGGKVGGAIIGQVNGNLKANYPGQYDGAKANALIKKELGL